MSYRLCCGTLSQSDLSLTVSVTDQNSSANGEIKESHTSTQASDLSIEDYGEELACMINDDATKVTYRKKVSKRRKGRRRSDVGKKNKFWSFHLKKRNRHEIEESSEVCIKDGNNGCVCTGYKVTNDNPSGSSLRFSADVISARSAATASPLQIGGSRIRYSMGAGPGGPGPSGLAVHTGDLLQLVPAPPQRLADSIIDLSHFNPDDYPTEDVDELRIAQRAREIELGLEISPGHVAYPHVVYHTSPPSSGRSSPSSVNSSLIDPMWNLTASFQNQCIVSTINYQPTACEAQTVEAMAARPSVSVPLVNSASTSRPPSVSSPQSEYHPITSTLQAAPLTPYIPQTIHTQVDYIHCLVPDLKNIAACSFYWGVMDRYEAERLLDNRPEGTFLLRDSAQEEFLFSVSFRRYGRSLHARIEQWNHKFSFDSHDPGVFAADTVTDLIEHYKDPNCCMFFEPMLTIPLCRNFPFSLQHLCRSSICSNTVYDGLNMLPLPKAMRDYLKYYHYKQKVRVRRFDMNN